jgi:hypothetical protein
MAESDPAAALFFLTLMLKVAFDFGPAGGTQNLDLFFRADILLF